MKIGIDISQLAYTNTGVANYLRMLVEHMVSVDSENEYVLFYSSLRRDLDISRFKFKPSTKVTIKQFKFPPKLLDVLWNKMHIAPIEWFIGDIDIFITSDWTEPPVNNAQKATIIYDMIVYKFPDETAEIIQSVQKRKLKWVKKESSVVFAISEATKKDTVNLLGIPNERVQVLYPGITL